MEQNKYKKLGINTILVFIGNIGSRLLSFLMLPFYSRWFSQADYGTIDYLGVYVSLIAIIISFSIGDAIFRFPKEQDKDVQASYFTSGILFLLLGYVFISLFWFFNIDYVFNQDLFDKYKGCITLLIIGTTLQSYLQQFCRSIDKMKIYVISGVVVTFFAVSLSFFLIPRLGIDAFFYSQIVAFFISSIYIFIHAKVWTFISFYLISKDRLKEMLSYSIPLIPNGVMWWILGSSNRFFLETYQGFASVGIFAVANKFSSLVSIVFNVFFMSWQISVLEEFNKGDYEEYYNKVLNSFFVLLSFVVIILSSLSYWIVYIFIDHKFLESWIYIPGLSIGVFLMILSGFIATNFLALKKTKIILISSLIAALVSIALNYYLIPIMGIWGAVLGLSIANVILVATRIIFSWKFVKIENLSRYCVSILLLIIFVLVISITNKLYLSLIINGIVLLAFCYINKNTLVGSFKLIKKIKK